MSSFANILKFLGAGLHSSATPEQHKQAAMEDKGQQAAAQVPQQMPVGAPALPSDSGQGASIPFSQFYAMVKGDPAKAEELSPGITKPGAYARMKSGPDGKPHVGVNPQKLAELQANPEAQNASSAAIVQAKMEEVAARHKALKTQKHVAEWISPDEIAKMLGKRGIHEVPVETLTAMFPGIEDPNGRMAYIRTDPTGKTMIRNPHSAGFSKLQSDIVGHQKQRDEAMAAEEMP